MFDYPRVYRGSREQIEATSQHPYQKWLLSALRFFFVCFSGFKSMGQDGFSDAQKVQVFSVILSRGD